LGLLYPDAVVYKILLKYLWLHKLYWSGQLTSERLKQWMREIIFASMKYERDNCKLLGISERVKLADNTQSVKIKKHINIIFSNNKY
jgi:hypothetical protein